MKLFKIIAAILLVLTLQGCISSGVKNAIDTADEHVRLKWSEEWKPALMEELRNTTSDVKDEAIQVAIDKIEDFEKLNEEKLKQIKVNPKDYDVNNDGKMQTAETLALVQELKNKNMTWWEILMVVAGAYVPLTGGKELLRSKMAKKGTGDGGQNDQSIQA